MFKSFPRLVYISNSGQRFSRPGRGGPWWLMMLPGIGLMGIALAMLVWPELLAYMVASLLLCAGTVLAVAGWRLRQIERRSYHDIRPLHDRDRQTPDNWVR